jgi:hypothetical protein
MQDFVAAVGTIATATFENEFQVVINSTPVNPWDVQLQHPISVEADKTYTVCYDGKAASPRKVKADVDQGGTPGYDSLMGASSVEVDLTTTMQSFKHTFTTTQADSTARLTFNIGGSTETVTLDNIGVYAGTMCPGATAPSPVLTKDGYTIQVIDSCGVDETPNPKSTVVFDSTTDITAGFFNKDYTLPAYAGLKQTGDAKALYTVPGVKARSNL